METLERQVETEAGDRLPLSVSVETLDGLDGLQLARPVKVYVDIGCGFRGPDDWDQVDPLC